VQGTEQNNLKSERKMDADGETGTCMTGVMPSSMSQSLDVPALTQALNADNGGSGGSGNGGGSDQKLMTTSMTSSTTSLNKSSRRITGHRNATSQNWFCFDEETSTEGRAELAAKEREREERIRRMKEQQEEERKRKLEELKQHAISAQKFREQQELERRRHIESIRSRDMDRRAMVEERRREIERTEQERRESILAKNKERECRISIQRRHSRGNIEFAFGSSAPRMVEHRDSSYWGTRSVYDPRRSAERDLDLKSKRTTSAQGLDRSNEGLSRENSTASRPNSAMSGGRGGAGVRLRTSGTNRRPRPLSIATTGMTGSNSGMTASMFEERQKPAAPVQVRNKSFATPKLDRMKRARSVTSEQTLEDDQRSIGSSTASGPVNSVSHPVRPSSARKTPAQVKAEAAARRAKMAGRSMPNTPKTSVGNVSSKGSAPVSPALSTDNLEGGAGAGSATHLDTAAGRAEGKRQITPDIIKDNPKKLDFEKEASTTDLNNDKESQDKNSDQTSQPNEQKEAKDEAEKETEKEVEKEAKPEKKIITSEEEAKARIADKRREMKEKMEREAEAERLRLEEEARIEAERLRAEEEEERRCMEETERLAAEARRAEEERIQRAIEENEAEERRIREEEERARREKEEQERRAKEEAERREIELQEKLKKEEEERQMRKKRIEEIMARTRGAKGSTPTSTPKKEVPATPDNKEEQQKKEQEEKEKDEKDKEAEKAKDEQKKDEKEEDTPSQEIQPVSLDTNIDPTKPDLLGDLATASVDNAVHTENARNLNQNGTNDAVIEGADTSVALATDDNNSSSLSVTHNGERSEEDEVEEKMEAEASAAASSEANGHETVNGEMEKGALDSLSNKSDDSQSSGKLSTMQSTLIEIDNGPSKKMVLGSEFDEILDLSGDRKCSPMDGTAPHQPIIAFEATTQQTDLLS